MSRNSNLDKDAGFANHLALIHAIYFGKWRNIHHSLDVGKGSE